MTVAYELRHFLAATGIDDLLLKRWVENDVVTPSIHRGNRPGDRNLWSEDDVALVNLLSRLHEAGCTNLRLKIVSDYFRMFPWQMHGGDLMIMRGDEIIVTTLGGLPKRFEESTAAALVARLR